MRKLSLSGCSNPLMPLQAVRSNEIPLVCIPGAGASVTVFIDLVGQLGERWPTYGLQPRGIDPTEYPHESVEEAALYNLAALVELNELGPIHLLGHSHGGLVAFDMARRLQEQGLPVASLTLIDSEPPATAPEPDPSMDISLILREFVDVLENTYGRSLQINDDITALTDIHSFVHILHAALIRTNCWSARSGQDMLHGPLATYSAARRTRYMPATRYAGKVHLLLVRDPCLGEIGVEKLREGYVDQWKRHVEELEVWYGSGHHFSILKLPHVTAVARCWRQAREDRIATSMSRGRST